MTFVVDLQTPIQSQFTQDHFLLYKLNFRLSVYTETTLLAPDKWQTKFLRFHVNGEKRFLKWLCVCLRVPVLAAYKTCRQLVAWHGNITDSKCFVSFLNLLPDKSFPFVQICSLQRSIASAAFKLRCSLIRQHSKTGFQKNKNLTTFLAAVSINRGKEEN